MKKIIVSGANGFIGRHLVRDLLNSGHYVISVVRGSDLIPKRTKNHKNNLIVPCDLNEINDLPNKIKPNEFDVYICLAWDGTSGDRRSNYKVQMNNVKYYVDSLNTAKLLGCKKFIGVGSISETEAFNLNNKTIGNPSVNTIYGASKLYAYMLTRTISHQINIDYTWLVLTNTYGPEEYSNRFVISTLKKIKNNKELSFTSGTQLYDFVYIDDVVSAIFATIINGKPYSRYIIGSGTPDLLKNYILRMLKAINSNSLPKFGDLIYEGVNLDKNDLFSMDLEKDTGFKALTSFEDGIKKTYEWILNKDYNDK